MTDEAVGNSSEGISCELNHKFKKKNIVITLQTELKVGIKENNRWGW